LIQRNLHIAKWWELQKNGKILCTLCPRYCSIGNGQRGFCYVRQNLDNKLYAVGYGRPTGFAIDPIEKKPLNHFYPGSEVLSFGTAGCNLGCKFCQNWTMSKSTIEQTNSLTVTPEQVISLAKKHNVKSIAFTYNDPTIFGEFVIDVSKLAKDEGIKTVMVTAGYIDPKAREEIYKYIDAANIDLKSFSENFYHKLTFSHLQDVLSTLIWLKRETNTWLEITTLLIPEENDSYEELKNLSNWIVKNLGDEVPLHFSAFHPDFKLNHKSRTPLSKLIEARNIAISEGIKYCYTGNVHYVDGDTTKCPKCNEEIIVRDWYSINRINLDGENCSSCGTKISGRFI